MNAIKLENISAYYVESISRWAGESLTQALVEEYQITSGTPTFQLEGWENPERTIPSERKVWF